MNSLRLIETKDGSHSLYNAELNETYHSIHGAIQESKHVFIENGLKYLIHHSQPKNISILEIGFGTGLNALLTALMVEERSLKIEYESVEAFPLSMATIAQLNYPDRFNSSEAKITFNAIHQTEWNKPQGISSNFNLLKRDLKIQDADLGEQKFDLVYFDAFAPDKQPEIWKLPILKKVADALNSNGIFVTYSAKGQLKRDLISLGLSVEKIPGPPGKREMIRAVKQ